MNDYQEPFKSHEKLTQKMHGQTGLGTPKHSNDDLNAFRNADSSPEKQAIEVPESGAQDVKSPANLTDGFRKTMQSKKSVQLDPNLKVPDEVSERREYEVQSQPDKQSINTMRSILKDKDNKKSAADGDEFKSISAVESVKFDEEKIK